jgi:hypothetical protein
MYAILKRTKLNGKEHRVKVMVLNATFNYISVIKTHKLTEYETT